MSTSGSHGSLTRRRLFAAGALLFASASAARAAPNGATSWLAYEKRMAARLDDAGGGQFDLDFSRALLAQANRFRNAQGLDRLEWDEGLAVCARAHVADMVARGYFAHESPEGFTHIERVGLLNRDLCGQTAENLAFRDYPSQRTLPQHMEVMWENSPGHRRNLANAAFGQAGYGTVRIGSRIYAAGVYGDAAVRLGRALPLNIKTDSELAAAIAGASPHIERLSLTAPFARPTWMAPPSKALPPLARGVWQLRPLRAMGATRYDVLPGPLFHIG